MKHAHGMRSSHRVSSIEKLGARRQGAKRFPSMVSAIRTAACSRSTYHASGAQFGARCARERRHETYPTHRSIRARNERPRPSIGGTATMYERSPDARSAARDWKPATSLTRWPGRLSVFSTARRCIFTVSWDAELANFADAADLDEGEQNSQFGRR